MFLRFCASDIISLFLKARKRNQENQTAHTFLLHRLIDTKILSTAQLRVNHAGELAATLIYAAQTPVVTAAHPHLRGLMQRMYAQEAGHLRTFEHLLARHRVRPTALYPMWQVAATALGWATAVMGREAAMACTEAVETEIGGHYNGQVRVLLEMIRELRAAGGDENVGAELPELLECVRRIRDEELEQYVP
jgi:ubiquinone biosynthesis monooxygenase Coq7